MKDTTHQIGDCPVCEKEYACDNWKTHHHILPKRYFCGEGGLFELCRECHNELEKLIPYDTQLTEEEYKQILCEFVNSSKASLNQSRQSAEIV